MDTNFIKKFIVDGYEIEIIGDNTFVLLSKITQENMKDKISQFKDIVENIDDDTFVETVDLVSEKIKIKEFDSLLNKQTFTKEEAENLTNKMSYFINTAHDLVNAKIKKLYDTDKILCKFF